MRSEFRVFWLAVVCLTALSFLLASCAPQSAATPGPTTTAPTSAAPTSAAPSTSVQPTDEKPKYGGTLILGLETDVQGFDPTAMGVAGISTIGMSLTNEELLIGDWTLGPAGSGKSDFTNSNFAPEGFWRNTGAVAESWQIPDNQTITFKIRKGIRWHNKPPVNGRELTPADVVFSIKYMYLNPKIPITYNVQSAPGGKKLTDVYIDSQDPQTVIVKVEDLAQIFIEDFDKTRMVAHEVIEKYGDVKDWRNNLGTGPFILTDYVPGSSLTWVKNPDYWGKNPIGPGKGDQLPYLDGIKSLTLIDMSTRLAAMRTAKVDFLTNLEWDDVEGLAKTSPEVKVKQTLNAGAQYLGIRTSSTDPLAAPLMKKRVRQAISMAIDHEEILNTVYSGKGLVRAFAFPPESPYYNTLDDLVATLQKVFSFKPEDAQMVKKMYEYHPDEAKKIMAEEGYPNGFKTNVLSLAADVDLVSVAADYLKKNLNIDLEIDVRDTGVYNSIRDRHVYPAMVMRGGGGLAIYWPERWLYMGPGDDDPKIPRTVSNYVDINDTVINGYIRRANAVYGDIDARSKLIKEVESYAIQTGWWIELPAPFTYNIYQPWVKNNFGSYHLGYRNTAQPFMYAWYDLDMKKAMGH